MESVLTIRGLATMGTMLLIILAASGRRAWERHRAWADVGRRAAHAIRHLGVLVLLSSGTLAVADPASYVVGAIPTQEARHDTTLSFQLAASHPGSATFAYTLDPGYPEPQGSTSLTPAGEFAYTPSSSDKFEFRVKFTGTVTGYPPDVQSVTIVPLATLPPEHDIILRTPTMPDPSSMDYLVVTQDQNDGPEQFNGAARTTHNVKITGKTIVFDSSSPLYGGLYTRFNDRADLKSLTIYAEQVHIRSPLKLPGTRVSLYARELRFEDTAGQAVLDTTPLGILTRPPQYQDGAVGQDGGDITLFVQKVSSSGDAPRLIANGGPGQDAGQGQPGRPKAALVVSTPLPPNAGPGPWMVWNWGEMAAFGWPFQRREYGWIRRPDGSQLPYAEVPYGANAMVVYVQSDAPCGGATGGTPRWPEDGEDAIPPGVPGVGGMGGTVSSLAALGDLARAEGGASGTPGEAQPGGPPQNPVYSLWLKTLMLPQCRFGDFELTAWHQSIAGKSAEARPAAQPQGPDGSFVLLPDPEGVAWLHPNLLWMVIAHAKDAYRNGNVDFARQIFQDYMSAIASFPTPPTEFEQPFEQARIEMQQLLHRIDSNLDYFGNPAGWVPMLSLEANMRAFTNEVDTAVPLLFVSRWLRQMADQNTNDVAALRDAMEKLKNDNLQAAAHVNEALTFMPSLQFQAAEVDVRLQELHASLVQRTKELEALAKDRVEDRHRVPSWRKAAGVIATIAKVLPVGQPWVGVVAQGIDFISKFNFDASKPLQEVQRIFNEVSDITRQVKAGAEDTTFSDAEAEIHRFVTELNENVDLSSFKNAKKTAEYLVGSYKKHRDEIDQIRELLRDRAVPQSEVDVELARLQHEDGAYNDIIERLRDVNVRKKELADILAQTLQTISSQTSTIDQNLLSIATMNDNLSTTVAGFDHRLAVYVRDMEQRAKERLLRYQYYMAKAYEYRMLKAYPGDFSIDGVVDGIVALIVGKTSYPGDADLSGVKSVYKESVRQIVATALDELQVRPPERSLPFLFELSPAELQQLNQAGTVSVDMAPRIAGLPNEDNRHIAGVSVAAMEVAVDGQTETFGRVRLLIDHHGQSTATSSGRTYAFQFGANQQKDAPFTWGASYDVLSQTISQEKLSTAGIELLKELLGIPGPLEPVALFARPGADAVVKLSKAQDPLDMEARITRVRISVTVDFFRSASNFAKLIVQTGGGALPYIAVDRADVSGRRDGLGTFRRTYNLGAGVRLTASPFYAGLSFRHWADGAGSILSTVPELAVGMSKSRVVRPVYGQILPGVADLSITKSDGRTAAVPGEYLTYTIVAKNAGPSPAAGAMVADPLPAELVDASWTCVGAGGGICAPAGMGSIKDSVVLPMGASVTYTLSATVGATASGSLTNTATVATPGGVTDPDPANNSATDIDTLPSTGASVQLGSPTYSVGEAGSVLVIPVWRTGDMAGSVTVDYATSDGTATAGSDYEAASGTLTLVPSEAPRTISVRVLNDTLVEGGETVLLTLSNPRGATLGSPNTAIVNILDDDVASSIDLASAAFRVDEGSPFATIMVVRTGATASGVSVDYATAEGSASAGSDYEPASGTLTFGAGVTSQTFTVPIVDDSLVEGTETVHLHLSNPRGGASLGPRSDAILTIEEDETFFQFSSPNYSAPEGAPRTLITVKRYGPARETASVCYQTSDGTAKEGVSYTPVSGSLTFAPGMRSRSFWVPLMNDTVHETNETVLLSLCEPSTGTALGQISTAVLSIKDNDRAGQLTFSLADYRVTQGSPSATITVRRKGGSAGNVTVDYATLDGTAKAGQHYLATSGKLIFDTGILSRSFTVPLLDAGRLPDLTLNLTLSNPTGGGTLAAPEKTVLTLVSRDPILEFSAPSYAVTEPSRPRPTKAMITVRRSGPLMGTLTVDYATSDGTATAGDGDYTPASGRLTFKPRQVVQRFPVFVSDDALLEDHETVNLSLFNPMGGAAVGDLSTAVLTIKTDDPLLSFSADAYTVAKAAGKATIVVRRSGPTSSEVKVRYATSDGTAQAGINYEPTSGILTFTKRAVVRTFEVTLKKDAPYKPGQTVNLTLSSPVGALLAKPSTAVLTIGKNDVAGQLQFAVSDYSVDEAQGTATITVVRSRGVASDVTVRYATSDGTALEGRDYDASSGTLTFGQGMTSQTFTVTIHPDPAAKGNRTVKLTLSDPSGGGTLGASTSATLWIVDECASTSVQSAARTLLGGGPERARLGPASPSASAPEDLLQGHPVLLAPAPALTPTAPIRLTALPMGPAFASFGLLLTFRRRARTFWQPQPRGPAKIRDLTMPRSSTVSALLDAWGKGNENARDELIPLVYRELRRVAARRLSRERREHTLQTTALVHETYLRLVEQKNVRWQSRAHFFAVAASLMRRILVDHARGHHAKKRGGEFRRVTLDDGLIASDSRDAELIALDEALEQLLTIDPKLGRIVELRFFGGLSINETAEVENISPATVKRNWDLAKAWLYGHTRAGEASN